MLLVFLVTSLPVIVVISISISNENLYEGDRCRNNNPDGESIGQCLSAYECSWALTQIRLRKQINICSFDGKTPIICCPPHERKNEDHHSSPPRSHVVMNEEFGKLSKSKCDEYYPPRRFGFSAVGGEEALSQEFPHMAILGFGSKENKQWKCGGALISLQHVLTAPLVTKVKRFIFDCMRAVNTSEDYSQQMAEILSEADYRGHFSHGMNRLEMYIDQIESGMCDNKACPHVLKESEVTAWVDGKNALGVVVANFCNKIAIDKARKYGIGCVSAKGSNHFGICAKYAIDAMKQGFIQFNCTNTSPLSVPTRANESFFGTNPFALGAPAICGDGFLLDMATTTVAVGKIELAVRKGTKIPETWALNKEGRPETDPKKAMEVSKLSPLGGPEPMGGYKGSGLLFMVEVLSGILSGSKYGPNIERWGKLTAPANLGHCFIVINPESFAPGFQDRLADILKMLRCLKSIDPQKPVKAAGDPEKDHIKAVDKAGGVQYVKNQMSTCEKLSKKLKVKPIGSVKTHSSI